MSDKVVKFDAAQQMLVDLSNEPETAKSCMCMCIMIMPDGNTYTATAIDDDTVRPFSAVGALELMKRRIMSTYFEKPDGL